MNAKPATLLPIVLTLACCGCSPDHVRGATTTTSPISPQAPAAPASSQPAPNVPRVTMTSLGVTIDGQPQLLYGGEFQYFRIRDPSNDPSITHRMWEETLDLMMSAGMNFAGIYVPWDYHELQEGHFRFDGVADLEAVLEMCYVRGIHVAIKPGPFINAEWPNGTGSYGAIPEWLKNRYPAALARRPNGRPFNFDPLGRSFGRQPSYFSPELLVRTQRWFARLAPIIRRYVSDRPTIFSIQIDNETNFFFSDRYTVDYSAHAIADYREFLRTRYGSMANLNAAYGTSHATFADVEPPGSPPNPGDSPARNRVHQDWWDAGHDGIESYLLTLRGYWESLGFHEPDIIFSTNDAPISLPLRRTLHWNSRVKNRVGLAMLDSYPRQFPTSLNRPADFPFITSYGSKRFAASNDTYRFAGNAPVPAGKCYGAEIQGGLLNLPFINIQLPAPPSTTDHSLLQLLGRGGALASVYVIREGINNDGSPYFSNAAIDFNGRLQPRFSVLQRYGRLISNHGSDLLRSIEAEANVALVVDSRFDAAAGGVGGDLPSYILHGPHATFGLLEDAGLNPKVLDLREVRPGDLHRFAAVFLLNSDVVAQDAAQILHDYVYAGGHLVNLGHLGHHDESWQRGTLTEQLLANDLFAEGSPVGTFVTNLITRAHMNLDIPNGPNGTLEVGPFMAKYTLSGQATAIAHDRTFPFGFNGPVTGWTASKGNGTVTHFGSNLGRLYGSGRYYDARPGMLLRLRTLVRWLCARAGAAPLVSVANSEGTAWARHLPGDGAFVFVGSRRAHDINAEVTVHDLSALGLDSTQTYSLENTLTGQSFSPVTGADLQAGISVPLEAYGTAVLRIR